MHEKQFSYNKFEYASSSYFRKPLILLILYFLSSFYLKYEIKIKSETLKKILFHTFVS